MKLLKLTIHNISSLPDAEVDFTVAPLRDASAFLICGETGSGKSSILDCICMALYGQVPRLGNTAIITKGKRHSECEENDVRNMIRSGCIEGFASLKFEGIDGERYTSTLIVPPRKNKTTSGVMPPARREIIADKNGEVVCICTSSSPKKAVEIDAQIKKLTGMDYLQFCRTTMLAQNGFDAFLKSDDKEKSRILEKITQRNFSAIGIRLSDLAKKKNEAATAAQKELAGITLLSESEKAAMQDQMKSCKEESEARARERDTARRQHSWLTGMAKLRADLEQSAKAETEKKAALESEAYKTREALIAEWDASAQARADLAKGAEARARIEGRLASEMRALRGRFADLLTALARRRQAAEKCEADLKALHAELDAWTPRALLLENYAQAYNHLSALGQARSQSARHAKTAADNEARLPAAQTRVDEARKAVAEAEQQLKTKVEERTPLEQEAALHPFEALNQAVIALTDRLAALHSAADAADDARQGADAAADARAEAERQEQAARKAAAELEAADQELIEATTRRKELQARADELATNKRKAMELRATLVKGCQCPVCTQTVGELVAIEELTISKELERTLHALGEAEKSEEACTSRRDQAREHAKGSAADAKTAKAVLDKLTAKSARQQKSLAAKLLAAGIADASTDPAEAIKEAIGKCEAEKAAAEKARQAASDLNDRIQRLFKEAEALQSAAAKAQKQASEAQSAFAMLEKSAGDAHSAAKGAAAQAGQELAALQALDGYGAWEFGDVPDAAAALATLRKGNTDYTSLKKEVESAEALQLSEREALARIGSQIASMRADHPCLADIEPSDTAYAGDLERGAARAAADFQSLFTRLDEAQATVKAADEAVAAFIAAHPQLHRERLAELAAMGASDINQARDAQSHAREAYAQARSAAATLREQIAGKEAEKPDMPEDADPARLQAAEAEADRLAAEANRQLGILENSLQTDKRNRKSYEDKEAVYKKLKAEADAWKEFTDHIADKDGAKLRNIATAMVLEGILSKASEHLKEFSGGRYRISMRPEDLRIDVADAREGGKKRPVNTASGGETFLVSLALALALGDSGTGLAADTIFIDEGFGSLSGEPLTNAMDVLRSLHQRVGIISHVPALQELLFPQLQVRRIAGTDASTIAVVDS